MKMCCTENHRTKYRYFTCFFFLFFLFWNGKLVQCFLMCKCDFNCLLRLLFPTMWWLHTNNNIPTKIIKWYIILMSTWQRRRFSLSKKCSSIFQYQIIIYSTFSRIYRIKAFALVIYRWEIVPFTSITLLTVKYIHIFALFTCFAPSLSPSACFFRFPITFHWISCSIFLFRSFRFHVNFTECFQLEKFHEKYEGFVSTTV